jgi:hypothetical protein
VERKRNFYVAIVKTLDIASLNIKRQTGEVTKENASVYNRKKKTI